MESINLHRLYMINEKNLKFYIIVSVIDTYRNQLNFRNMDITEKKIFKSDGKLLNFSYINSTEFSRQCDIMGQKFRMVNRF